MRALHEITIEELAAILSRGSFDDLIASVEHAQLECKRGLYDIKSVKGKIELAKDVSALANSRGGYLLIGPSTQKSRLHDSDEVVSISCFVPSLLQPDTYRKILSSYIYPPIANVKIEWHASKVEPSKGIVSIFIPPEVAIERPFLVVQSEVSSQVSGHLFGYFERSGAEALPTSVQLLRDRMKDGKRFNELERRMDTFEGLLAKLLPNHSSKQDSFNYEQLLQRAADAKIAAQLTGVPSFFLLAFPIPSIRMNGLYSSQSSEHQAINKPPRIDNMDSISIPTLLSNMFVAS